MRQDLGDDKRGQNEDAASKLNIEAKPIGQSDVSEVGSPILLNEGIEFLLHFLFSLIGAYSDETVERGSEEGVDWRTRHRVEAKRVDDPSGVGGH